AAARGFVVGCCHELYKSALRERKEAWRTSGVSVTLADQSAQLHAVTAVRPEFRDIHSQVLQDVLTRLDHTFHAFFRRVFGRAARWVLLPRAGRQVARRADACLSALWAGPGPRRERRPQRPAAGQDSTWGRQAPGGASVGHWAERSLKHLPA